jgi:hypothetical protein
MLATLLVLLAAPPGFAAAPPPATATVVSKPDADTFIAAWPDAAGVKQSMIAAFPSGALSPTGVLHFEEPALMAVLGERLQAWATETRPGSVVVVNGTTVTLKTPPTSTADAESENAATSAERARLHAALLVENHLGIVGPGILQYDHARMAGESAAALAPLVKALGPTTDVRAFAARALAFVQSLPVEELARVTFSPPLVVLGEQHGNCDEKATLYAALIHAAAPTLPVAVLTMRAHAIVGLGLPAGVGDRTVTVGGTAWVVADVAGPTLHELGRLSAKSDLQQLTVKVVP